MYLIWDDKKTNSITYVYILYILSIFVGMIMETNLVSFVLYFTFYVSVGVIKGTTFVYLCWDD